MTPDDITRLAWSSKIISELAALTCLRVSDEHFDAEVLPREAVMDAVCKIMDATREGEAVIRTLAQQGKAWPAIVQHCVATEAVTPDESDPHGTIRRLIDYHVEMDREQGKAGGVAEKYDDVLLPFVALMRAELHANSGKGDRPGWLRMSTDTCLLEIYYHLAKLQKAVRKEAGNAICEHAADVANMAMMLVDICGGLEVHDTPPANPPEAGVTDAMVERACAAHDRMYDHCGGDTRASMREDMRRALTAALAPQPKDAP